MSSRVNGITAYSPGGGSTSLVATRNGALYRWTGVGCAEKFTLAGDGLDTTGIHRMVQANDVIYGTDKVTPVFRFDGTTFTQPVITAADGVTRMQGVSDLIWMYNRLWFAIGDYIYWTDVSGTNPLPETIVDAPIRVRAGGGDKIVRLVPYRQGYIVVFKRGASGNGSIHLIDATANDPDYFQITPLFDNISIIAPDAICRSGSDPDSDILFATREGFRSLRFTSLDKLTAPTLPFSQNVKTELDQFNHHRDTNSWAVVFDDELLWFVPTGGNVTPDTCLAWTFKEPQRKEYLAQGWTVLNNIPATCGCVAALSGKPKLWIGTNDNRILDAFYAIDDTLYREVSKRIDFGEGTKDKRLLKLIYVFDRGSSGTVTAKLQKENGDIYVLGSREIESGGVQLPTTLPATLGATGISTETWDLRYDADGKQLPRFQDVRVILESNDDPRILGFELLAQIEKHRFTPLAVTQTAPVTASAVTGDTLNAENVKLE